MTKEALSVEDTLKLALEALDFSTSPSPCVEELQDDAIAAIKEALMSMSLRDGLQDGAQPKQEPKKDLMFATVAMQEREDKRIENIVATLEKIKQEQLTEMAQSKEPEQSLELVLKEKNNGT